MSTNEYISTPNLPKKPVKKVIADCRINDQAINRLKQQGIEVILSKKLDNLYDAVSAHPDMQIHHLGGNLFICEPSVYEYYKNKLKNAEIICSNTHLKPEYPFDIAFNAARIGNYVFHNFKYTDLKLYEYYKQIGVKLINVKQGYSKCSICPISENALITSDIKIYEACADIADAMYFNPRDIILNGMDNGLVGGICGKISNNLLAVNGDISLCTDGLKFIDFCNKYSIKILNLTDEKPVDIGSIIPIC